MINVLIIWSLVLHFIFLASIFEIYFQSPVILNLTPQNDLDDAPAKRLVLFVADGLRAESFFQNDCNRTQYLKSIILNEGTMGISHCRVPTESRPGHVALIAGLYEDPSAVAKGWQDNPVDFDSVFKRSRETFAWGSPDVVRMFSKDKTVKHVHTEYYESYDFSGKDSTTLLDEWVFIRFQDFLIKAANLNKNLLNQDKTVFFCHLLGLDTAGHVHKPHSELYTENMVYVDSQINKTVQMVENTFKDKKTAYIFTSDHGMTDRGAHGAGEHFETETPFIAWGAGIKNPHNHNHGLIGLLHVMNGGEKVKRFDIEQADVAPLMSSLIGTAVPTNNFGKLPEDYLNVSTKYLAYAWYNNANQIIEQYKKVYNDFSKGYFAKYQKTFHFDSVKLNKMDSLLNNMLQAEEYYSVITLSKELFDEALQGIEYYQQYYQIILLYVVALSMILWICCLLTIITKENVKILNMQNITALSILFLIVLLVSFFYIHLQKIPYRYLIYTTLPVLSFPLIFIDIYDLKKHVTKIKLGLLFNLIMRICFIEFLVLSFFNRYILTFLFIMIILTYKMIDPKYEKTFEEKTVCYKWILTSIIVSIFPSLPIVEKDSNIKSLIVIAGLLFLFKNVKHDWNNVYCKSIGIITIIGVLNLFFTIYNLDLGNGVYLINQIISWLILGASLFLPLLSKVTVNDRLISVMSLYGIPYTMLSLSYEPIFYICLSLNLYYWIQMEYVLCDKINRDQFQKIKFTRIVEERQSVSLQDCRRMFLIILYILVSFFGTGNIASVSSFDPNWVRCFVTTFSPFLMAALIIFKFLIPIMMVTCVLKAIHILTEISMDKLFIIILIICDIMCLNFLFLVKNKGSWLEIGTSISHFIIMEFTALVLIILYKIINFLTTKHYNYYYKISDNNILLSYVNNKIK